MISLFIIMLIVLALMSAAGYAGFSLYRSFDSAYTVTSNVMNMERIVMQIQGNMRPVGPGNVLYSPMGEQAASIAPYMTVPTWITSDYATPWGIPYAYCPYAPEGAHLSEGDTDEVVVTEAGGATYSVDTLEEGDAREFVVSGDLPPVLGQGIVGLLVSPLSRQESIPNCSDVSFSDGNLRVAGGIVRAIYGASSTDGKNQMVSTDVVRFVSPSGSGTEDGLTPYSPMTLADVLEQWRRVAPASLTIHLESGAYNLTDGDLNIDSLRDPSGKSLRFIGEGGVILSASSGYLDLAVPVNLELRDVTFSNVGLNVQPGKRVELWDSSIASVSARHAEVHLRGSSRIDASSTAVAYPIVLRGGRVVFDNSVGTLVASSSTVSFALLLGGDLVFDGRHQSGPYSVTNMPGGSSFFTVEAEGRVIAIPDGLGEPTVSLNGGAQQPIENPED